MNHLLTLSDVILAHARTKPEQIAVRDSVNTFSYQQLNLRASQLALAMISRGLKKGDQVCVLAYNRAEWVEIYVGLARAGLVVVPINFRLSSTEIAYILEHSEAKAIIVQDSLSEKLEALKNEILDKIIFVIGNDEQQLNASNYENALKNSNTLSPTEFEKIEGEDIFALMYTSGTTGKPKGAIRSHAGNMMIALATSLEFEFKDKDTALLVMPMCHANSLYFMITFLYIGGTINISDKQSFDPEDLLRTFAHEKITFTSLVPTHYIMMLGLSEEIKVKYDVSSISKLLISSAPARRDTKLAILDYFKNSKLFELYGSTEAGWVTLLRPDEQLEKLGSVGREWVGSGAIRILNENREEVLDGEVGELFSRTSYAFDGYWKNVEKTKEAFQDKWCSVGDMARRDSEGFVYLVDRKSNMIISGGENIYPSELENVIGANPKVKDVAVVGVPDQKWGESVIALIVTHIGETVTEKEIQTWCKKYLASFKTPRKVIQITENEMPRNATGKILHRVLREKYQVIFQESKLESLS